MLKRFWHRAKRARVDFINHMHPMNRVNQEYHATLDADRIVTDARRRGQLTGVVLYSVLGPHGQWVAKTGIDPYKRNYDEAHVRQWLLYHVIYDGAGEIIAVRDGAVILTRTEGYGPDIKTYFDMRGY